MHSRFRWLAVAGAAAILSPATWAETPGQIYMNAKEMKWADGPPGLPKGAKMTVLMGDPGKEGAFVARAQFPANYKIPAHWHSQDEDLTVISGTFYLAEGDKLETAHAHAIAAGGFHHLPAKTHHYAYTKAVTVVQINGKGPFDITYIDPKDDPGKMAEGAKPAEAKKK